MRKYFLIIYLLVITSISFSQWDVSTSMGLDFKSIPRFRDYVNINFATINNQISSFKSTVAFGAEVDYKVNKNLAIGLEYNLQLDSYNGTQNNYEISYGLHRPSLMAYYVIPGIGYQFKLGGGIGYRYAALEEKIFSVTSYSSHGFGLVLKAVGNTILANNFYALIGGNLRYDYTGDLANGSQSIINKSSGEKLNLNSISFGIYLGVTFTF